MYSVYNIGNERRCKDMAVIQFKGKDVTVTDHQPGVVKKSDSIFYVQDSATGEWLYCSAKRLDQLNAKHNNDLSQYKGRASRKAEKTVQAE